MAKKTLEPQQQPIKIKINPLMMILMFILFALVFFVIGIWTMHYPKIWSVI